MINAWLIRGDTHGDFSWLRQHMFEALDPADTAFIILGDCGINIGKEPHDSDAKRAITRTGFNIYCVRGNHEIRPSDVKDIKDSLLRILQAVLLPHGILRQSQPALLSCRDSAHLLPVSLPHILKNTRIPLQNARYLFWDVWTILLERYILSFRSLLQEKPDFFLFCHNNKSEILFLQIPDLQ